MNNAKMGKYIISAISVLVLCLMISDTGIAQVPKTLNWQAYIENPDGTPVGHPTPETKTITFAIYDSETGGSPLWGEEHTVTIEKGKASVLLGKTIPIELSEPKTYYLGVTVEGSSEERRELASTLYALFVDGITLDNNIFVGNDAGFSNTEGGANIFIGEKAGYNNTEGGSNIFIGGFAGAENTVGWNNIFIGTGAGYRHETGRYNVFVGPGAGGNHETGNENIFVGPSAGSTNTDGEGNTFVGFGAGTFSEGSKNVFIGHQAGRYEKGSNKLYIDNSRTRDPLIYGEFDNRIVALNGNVGIKTEEPYPYGSLTINSPWADWIFLRQERRTQGGGGFHIHNAWKDTDDERRNYLDISYQPPGESTKWGQFVLHGPTGNIGIGTVNPEQKLHVDGSLQVDNHIITDGNVFLDNGSIIVAGSVYANKFQAFEGDICIGKCD